MMIGTREKATCNIGVGLTVLLWIGAAAPALAAQEARQVSPPTPTQPDSNLPVYLQDRGTGVATSMFGTYIRRGELIVYPYWEYYRDRNWEYKPKELGLPGAEDFRGRYRASEGLFFLAYGLTDDLAVQVEGTVIRASLEKSPADLSVLPARIKESGLGDREVQLRWRWRKENDRRPELFSYLDVGFPHNKDKPLIGTPRSELELGTGLTRGFKWGTLTARASVGYSRATPSGFDLGEVALEYLKRVSPAWRFYVSIGGTQDEVSLITEAQWHLGRHVFIRFNQELGLTSKATDWEPQLGILFTVPTR